MRTLKRDFIRAFERHCNEQGYLELLDHEHEFKTENWCGETMFVFQWQDGQIEFKDTYHFDGKTIRLFKAEKRYDFGKPWMEAQ